LFASLFTPSKLNVIRRFFLQGIL